DWTQSEPGSLTSIRHAAMWRDGALLDLNDCVPSDSPYELESAEAINDKGQILVQAGSKDRSRWIPTILLLTPTAK
ncbi:MAG TPA: hypothetical protein VG944_22825, partial [Fimbriimonas sp.]|nr:hypothetical protein [Fimbriimonas sp.]